MDEQDRTAHDRRQMAEWLRAMREVMEELEDRASRPAKVTARSIEVLLWVSLGADCTQDLRLLVGGCRQSMNQLVRDLAGLRVRNGASGPRGLPLLEFRKHPHRQAKQIVLSPQGLHLLRVGFARREWIPLLEELAQREHRSEGHG